MFWVFCTCTLTGYIIRYILLATVWTIFLVLRAALILGAVKPSSEILVHIYIHSQFGFVRWSVILLKSAFRRWVDTITTDLNLTLLCWHKSRLIRLGHDFPILCCPILLSPFKCQPQFPVHSWQKEHSLWCFAAVDHICFKFLRCCVFSDVLLCILSVNHFCLFSAQNSLSFDVWHQ